MLRINKPFFGDFLIFFLAFKFSCLPCLFFSLPIIALSHDNVNLNFDSSKIIAVFNVDRTNEDEFWAHITLENQSSIPLTHWQLGFTFQRIITVLDGAKIVQQIGDYYLLDSDQIPSIAPGGSATFKVQGKYTLRNEDDLPTDYFLILRDANDKVNGPVPIMGKNVLLPYKPVFLTPGINDYELNIQHNETPIEGNPPDLVLPVESSLIVPLPVEITLAKGNFILKPDTAILVQSKYENVIKIAEQLNQSLNAASGYHLMVQISNEDIQPENSILFTTQGTSPDLGNEGYLLKVTPKRVTVQAITGAGFFYGMQSLKQLFPPEIWRENAHKHSIASDVKSNIRWEIPCLSIKDYPRFAYRGVLLDSARHFFTTDQVKRLLDLMAMHKLNTFHWHLSDDEGWRIQIIQYPQLTEIGAWRGYDLAIPPALGTSNINRYGGFYTQDDIRNIVRYAQDRYITIIPEIDIPAHSRALIRSLPDKLKDANDHTIYSSVRGFHDNVLSPCMETTYEVINHIIDEIVELFPGPYIHIGVDERPKNAWKDSPACIALMKKEGLNNTDELQHHFVNKIQGMLASKNKSVAAWEEAMKGGKLEKKPMPLIYSWKSAEEGLKAAEQGYDVILTPASNLYLELAYSADPSEPGDYWSGYVDTFTVYAYKPIPPNLSAEAKMRVKGIEGALWSEYISSPERLDYLAFPKMSALAEVAWTSASRRNWRNFSMRMGHLHLPRLDQYGVNYRLSPPGIQIISQLLNANNEFSGLVMRYTLDGSLPMITSEIYKVPVKITGNVVEMRSFSSLNRGSGVVKQVTNEEQKKLLTK